MNSARSLAAFLAVCLACTPIAGAGVIYVDDSATGDNNGSTWEHAFTELQSALDVAVSGDAIWIAAGTYTPSMLTNANDPRTATFQLIRGVSVYGGFAGMEDPATFDLADRDFVANKTIFSGDLNGDDVPVEDPANLRDEPTRAENCYHVFYHPDTLGLDDTAILDGVTITGGNADGSSPHGYGGGMYNKTSSPTMTLCTFEGNAAGWGGGVFNNSGSAPAADHCLFDGNAAAFGGGMYNDNGSDPTLAYCTISGNFSGGSGGGLNNNASSPTLTHCMFSGNVAENHGGGGMASYPPSYPTLTHCTFSGNSTGERGGGMYNDGATPTLKNCWFAGNSAGIWGGGMCNEGSSASLINCTLVGNDAGENGGGLYNEFSAPVLTNTIVWGNTAWGGTQVYSSDSTPTFSHCNIAGSGGSAGWDTSLGTDAGGNIDEDPQFVRNPDPGPDRDWDGVDDDYGDLRLACTSPCLDAGTNDTDPPLPATDLDGNPRIVNGVVDMGAYEGPTRVFLIVPESVDVPEGGSAGFNVALACDPGGPATVSVAFDSGDPDVTVESGSVLMFDSSNYATPQPVTLVAAEDGDQVEGTTLFRITADGVSDGIVTAHEVENDIGPVVFVDADAEGTEDGNSWTNAFTDLQSALTAALAAPRAVEQIWVAAGTYTPSAWTDPGDSRTATFQLINTVAIHGGFAGTEDPATFNLADRDLVANETILSGDLNGDDGSGGDNSENCYHVFYHPAGTYLDNTAVLDGVTITGGNAEPVGSSSFGYGGGMFNEESSPTLTDCRFLGNAADAGGGMYNDRCAPTLAKCQFDENSAQFLGGGMANYRSNPTLNHCTLSRNSSSEGGGMQNSSGSPTLTYCVFSRNWSSVDGGGMHNGDNPTLTSCLFTGNWAVANGGGMYNVDAGSSNMTDCLFTGNWVYGDGGGFYNRGNPTLTDCVLSGNMAYGNGGGMYNNHSSSTPTLTNCTFSANQGTLGGAMLNNDYSAPTLVNCILWGDTAQFAPELFNMSSTPTISYCNIAGSGGSGSWDATLGTDGGGNIDDDPLFVRMPSDGGDGWPDDLATSGVDESANNDYGNLRSLPGSPCIDAADNDAPGLVGVSTDLDGRDRFMDDPLTADTGNGTPPIVDMGPYEFVLIPGDYDQDGDVDGDDLAVFESCASGPTVPHDGTPTCQAADFEDDGDVDQSDFGVFQRCLSGEGIPADPTCAD